MRTVLTTLPLNGQHLQMLEAAAKNVTFCHTGGETPTLEQMEEASVIIGNVSPELLVHASHLELLQLNSAGTDGYTAPGVLPKGARLANASGAYGLAISEHMLAMLLALIKKMTIYADNKKEHQWLDEGPVRSIFGSRTLVIGMGDIGGEFARKMNALGSTVVGMRRHAGEKPDYAAAVYTMDELDEQLALADFVACSLPGTPATYHLFDEVRIGKMKRGAVLINVGRGNLIENEALCKALCDGTLGGACLDVTDPEPLPKESPLWEAPNLILTPHVSGGFHLEETLNRIVEIAAQNLKAVCEGTPIVNEVDFETGYRKLENRR